MALSHQRELDQLHDRYYPEPDLEDDDDYAQPTLTGATINQGVIAGGSGETIGKLWSIDRLLENNSSHVLLIGQTGSGKTTLARWLLSQLKADKTIVLDADDDRVTWTPYPTIGAGDDWVSIEGAMMEGLEDFKNRKPNDPALPMTIFILEELPDLISECQSGVNFCSRILRRGRKRKMFVIGLTQDPNSGSGIGLSQPVQKCFSRIYLGGMARHCLSTIVPRAIRPALNQALNTCQRGAIVEFLGEWYAWDVPDLSSTAGNQTPKPSTQTIAAEEGTIATLERTFSTPPIEAGLLHWEVLDLSVAMPDQWLSTRETMRRIPQLKTADQAKSVFADLTALELGQTRVDGARTLFKAFSPIV
jgi:energy-coupling factor transporter ATP-binding protein EcfA2